MPDVYKRQDHARSPINEFLVTQLHIDHFISLHASQFNHDSSTDQDVYKRQRQDQQRFKDMLVYPGYSNTENYSAKYANYLDDTKNGVTFYWNIYNFDAARFGNQGLFAARSMMAVSYTHLDVYKRQSIYSLMARMYSKSSGGDGET